MWISVHNECAITHWISYQVYFQSLFLTLDSFELKQPKSAPKNSSENNVANVNSHFHSENPYRSEKSLHAALPALGNVSRPNYLNFTAKFIHVYCQISTKSNCFSWKYISIQYKYHIVETYAHTYTHS